MIKCPSNSQASGKPQVINALNRASLGGQGTSRCKTQQSLRGRPLASLPLRFAGAGSAGGSAVDKATSLLQLFHAIRGLDGAEFARRFLVLQVNVGECAL